MPTIEAAAANGLVVIVAMARIELAQWRERLGISRVSVWMATSEVALELSELSTAAHPPTGVLLTTPTRLDRGLLRNALRSVPVALAVVDGKPRDLTRAASSSARLVEIADRSIVVDDLVGGPTPEWLGPHAVVEVSLDEVIGSAANARAAIGSYQVTLGEDEQEVLDRAAKVLGRPVAWRSRIVLHAGLLQLISTAEQAGNHEGDQMAEAWSVVDDLENLGPDPRLAAVLQAAVRMRNVAPVVIVTGGRLVEAEYVQDHLIENGVDADLWTVQTQPSADKASAQAKGPPFPVAVATTGSLDVNEQWLTGSALVYFTEPHTDREHQRLHVALATGAIHSASTPRVTDLT
ncbi:hypothetical protein [Asanoa sp. NPDC050611]|uniref:hypothetical protein n=1 Tax=Asanoa sp. NPDC050611 TaxID=3157098 RepID=UPI0033E83EB3